MGGGDYPVPMHYGLYVPAFNAYECCDPVVSFLKQSNIVILYIHANDLYLLHLAVCRLLVLLVSICYSPLKMGLF